VEYARTANADAAGWDGATAAAGSCWSTTTARCWATASGAGAGPGTGDARPARLSGCCWISVPATGVYKAGLIGGFLV